MGNKLMGQVNLALAARDVLREDGSITLIAGVLSLDPIVVGSSASMVNGAIETFARAAAIELPRGLRINAVSPTVFEESMASYGPFFAALIPCRSRGRPARSPAASRGGRPGKSTEWFEAIPRILLALVAELVVVGVVFAVWPDLDWPLRVCSTARSLSATARSSD